MWLLRASETMMKHSVSWPSCCYKMPFYWAAQSACHVLMLQVFAAYPAIVLASCFGHRYHATPSHQSFSNSQWCNAFPVLPHIHAGPVKICTVLDLTKQT